MTPFDNKNAVMYRLLEDMTSLRRQLDDIQDQASKNWKVMETISAENRLYRNVLESLAERFFLRTNVFASFFAAKSTPPISARQLTKLSEMSKRISFPLS